MRILLTQPVGRRPAGGFFDWPRQTIDAVSKELGHTNWYKLDSNDPHAKYAHPDNLFTQNSPPDEPDDVQTFLNERCMFGADLQTPKADLYDAYRSWYAEHGQDPHSNRGFNAQLKRRDDVQETRIGVERRKTWVGVGLV